MLEYEKLRQDKIFWSHKLKRLKERNDEHKRAYKDYAGAKEIINQAIELVHTQFKEEIESAVTKAIRHVFRRDIEFKLIYERVEAGVKTKVAIIENGEEMNPKDDLGGSVIDVVSFIFRIVVWNMSRPLSRNCFVVDEPFRWTGKLIQVTALIMKELSIAHNFQIIMATHEDELIDIADKVFLVEHNGTESIVREIKRQL